MAKEKQEARLLADEKFINHIGDFLFEHVTKLIIAFLIVMVAVVVVVVSAHASRSHEDEVGDYLEENLYTPLGLDNPSQYGVPYETRKEAKIDVDAVLDKVKDARVRPLVLTILARHLFEIGNLKRAEELARFLRDDYADPEFEFYQRQADGVLSKIKDQREFTIPEPQPLGPAAPAEEKAAPAEETTAPAEETTAPAEETTAPAEETTAPAEEKPAPAEETTAPAEEKPAPAEETTAPAEEKPPPADES